MADANAAWARGDSRFLVTGGVWTWQVPGIRKSCQSALRWSKRVRLVWFQSDVIRSPRNARERALDDSIQTERLGLARYLPRYNAVIADSSGICWAPSAQSDREFVIEEGGGLSGRLWTTVLAAHGSRVEGYTELVAGRSDREAFRSAGCQAQRATEETSRCEIPIPRTDPIWARTVHALDAAGIARAPSDSAWRRERGIEITSCLDANEWTIRVSTPASRVVVRAQRQCMPTGPERAAFELQVERALEQLRARRAPDSASSDRN